MVNRTILEKFTKLSQNSNPMKKWSLRSKGMQKGEKSWYVKSMIQKIRAMLKRVSGGDMIEMLRDVLTRKEIELLMPNYKEALKNMSETYRNTFLKERHNLMRPIKKASFKRCHVRRLGYPVSKHLWKGCGDARPRNKGGRPSIDQFFQTALRKHLEENSNIASNRLVKGGLSARYLNDNKKEIFKSFQYNKEMCRTTFDNHLGKTGEFKKPHRLTDLCDYCEKALHLKNKISRIMREENLNFTGDYVLDDLTNHFTQQCQNFKTKFEESDNLADKTAYEASYDRSRGLITDLHDIRAILFHKNVAQSQRQAYNEHQSPTFLKNKIMIEADYKEKIKIGLSPRQISKEFYKQEQRSCLSFGVYYELEGEVYLINFTIISNDLAQDAYSSVRGFRILREQTFFKDIQFDQNGKLKDWVVWFDCGPHFRNKEVLGYLLLDLAGTREEPGIHDKHGKNNRDTHFSNISKFLLAESLQNKISNSQEIKEAIIRRQHMADENRRTAKRESLHVYVLDQETDDSFLRRFPKLRTLEVTNVCSFYNYRTIGPEYLLYTSVLSNNENLLKMRTNAYGSYASSYVPMPEIQISEIVSEDMNIHKKRHRIIGAFGIMGNKVNHDKNEVVFAENENMLIRNFSVRTNFGSRDNAERIGQENETLYYDYFSNVKNRITENIPRVVLNFPETCRVRATPSKPKCQDCQRVCAFTMEALLNEEIENTISTHDIQLELKYHGHPSMKKICIAGQPERARTKEEALRELADHYISIHNQKEPIIFQKIRQT